MESKMVSDMITLNDELKAEIVKLNKTIGQKDGLIADLYGKNSELNQFFIACEIDFDKKQTMIKGLRTVISNRDNELKGVYASLQEKCQTIENLRTTLGEVRQEKADLLNKCVCKGGPTNKGIFDGLSVNEFITREYKKDLEKKRPEDFGKTDTTENNKPSWDEAPCWASYLIQNSAGQWWWVDSCPSYDKDGWIFEGSKLVTQKLVNGDFGIFYEWQNTLEKRPAK